MQGIILALALASIGMSSIAQVLLKAGMTHEGVRAAIAGGGTVGIVRAVALNPAVLGGLGMYGLGTVLWLAVLTRVELSQAYPFVGLSFVLTALFGWLLFNDAMSAARIGGVALIVAGVVLVGRS